MFSAHCDGCGSEVLLSSRRIVALRHTDHGIVVTFRCWSGHVGTWVTGRRARPTGRATRPSPRAAAPAGAGRVAAS